MLVQHLTSAYALIEAHDYETGIMHLKCALKCTDNRNQWSRIMSAIRYARKAMVN